jgi:hypothetical protein
MGNNSDNLYFDEPASGLFGCRINLSWRLAARLIDFVLIFKCFALITCLGILFSITTVKILFF